jgi:Papain-like cysteine protease AvrRpt2
MLATVPLQNPERIQWRFQGMRFQCWLTAIEMLMFWKHGNIYGVDSRGNHRTQHADHARQEAALNRGSYMSEHIDDYGLVRNAFLRGGNINYWRQAIRDHGPVLVSGRYGLGPKIGWGNHVILVVGVSSSGQLAYYNPNILALFPHPQSKLSYMTLERCRELVHFRDPGDLLQCQD